MTTRIASVLAGQAPVGSRITIEGWVRTRRDSKAGLSFLAVHDGSCFDALQVVAPAELANYQADVLRITSGCAVRVTGEVVASQGKGQTVELRGETVEVVGWVDDPDHYPMQPKRHTMEYLREVAHLRPRTNVIGAVTRVRHTLAQAVHRFFHEHGFFWIHTPIITASDAEGAGQMFRVSTLDAANPPRTPDGTSTSTRTSSARRPGSPCRGSSTSRPTAWRCRGSIRSGRRSAPRTRTPGATSPSSG